ncbi:hypothetical protein N790_07190 [Arenimonas malthae CC-JY-1]|uniref:DUF4124 domain-containing protein n=1 Tax=Arenimonas malthae CC-JY-1 TaxID=1384054 RepID=A0A091B5D7_9GAMM|nr:DUF4124 domain-containing protein [Arenimonas malthae]KFN47848.1 hypothetical protein N790_07190 [Arenimonas malthae CC-JY-1]
MRRKSLFPALAIALLLSPAAQAAVYKCTINGETRYQDNPCPGRQDQKPHIEDAPAPAAGAPAGPAAAGTAAGTPPPRGRTAPKPPLPQDDDTPLDRVGQLYHEILAAQAAQRVVLDGYREAVQALAAAQKGREQAPEAESERKQLEHEWKERRFAAGDRVRALQAELRRLCPNGTMMSGARQVCR